MSKTAFEIQPLGKWYGASAAIKRPKVIENARNLSAISLYSKYKIGLLYYHTVFISEHNFQCGRKSKLTIIDRKLHVSPMTINTSTDPMIRAYVITIHRTMEPIFHVGLIPSRSSTILQMII